VVEKLCFEPTLRKPFNFNIFIIARRLSSPFDDSSLRILPAFARGLMLTSADDPNGADANTSSATAGQPSAHSRHGDNLFSPPIPPFDFSSPVSFHYGVPPAFNQTQNEHHLSPGSHSDPTHFGSLGSIESFPNPQQLPGPNAATATGDTSPRRKPTTRQVC